MTFNELLAQPKTRKLRKEGAFRMTRRIFPIAALGMLLVVSMMFSTGAASTRTPFKTTAAPVSCGSACVQNLSFCRSTCNGNSICLAQCQDEYECCQVICHGGSCRRPPNNDALTVRGSKRLTRHGESCINLPKNGGAPVAQRTNGAKALRAGSGKSGWLQCMRTVNLQRFVRAARWRINKAV